MGSRRVHYSIGRGGEATGGGDGLPPFGGEWKRDPVWVVFRACSSLHTFTNRLTESLDEACVAREDDSTCNGHITMREFTTEPPKKRTPHSNCFKCGRSLEVSGRGVPARALQQQGKQQGCLELSRQSDANVFATQTNGETIKSEHTINVTITIQRLP